jgi:BASS family bile acid:Na+ symporter
MDESQLIGPLVLVALMIVVGLQLTPADFRRVLGAPRVVVVGTLGQLLLLPIMTWCVLSLLGLPPIFGAGAVLLAAAPGAGMSNVMTAIARAHVALSVTLTAMTSVLAPITLPALTAVGVRVFLGDAAEIEVPVALLFGQLFAFLLLPIGIGMLLRARRPEAALRYISLANRVAVVAIIVLTIVSAVGGSDTLPSSGEVVRVIPAALAWTFGAMGVGWVLATLLDLDADDRFTFLVEYSARNIALAFIVAVASFGRLDLALFAGVYAVTGFPVVIVLAVVRGRWARKQTVEITTRQASRAEPEKRSRPA